MTHPLFYPNIPISNLHTTQQISVRWDSGKYNQLRETFVLCLLSPPPPPPLKYTHTSYSRNTQYNLKIFLIWGGAVIANQLNQWNYTKLKGSIFVLISMYYISRQHTKVHHIMYKIIKNIVVLSILHYLFKVLYHNYKKWPAYSNLRAYIKIYTQSDTWRLCQTLWEH